MTVARQGPELRSDSTRMHRLGHASYGVFVNALGCGWSDAAGLRLTRWSGDPIEQHEGLHVFVRDAASGAFWSAAAAPAGAGATRYRTGGRPGVWRLEREDHGIALELDVAVAPDATAELRRLTLRNASGERRRLEITSLVEVVLNDAVADGAHPGFSKLFVETGWDAASRVLFASRRARAAGERFPVLAHAILEAGEVGFETDRAAFLGRGRARSAPEAVVRGGPLDGALGAVLDPVLALRRTIELAPGESVTQTFVLGTAPDAPAAAALVRSLAARGGDALLAAAAAAADAAGESAPDAWSPAPDDADAPASTTVRPHVGAGRAAAPTPPSEVLASWNGFGGFRESDGAYVMRLEPGADGEPRLPPLPWCNVIANERAGLLVSERGAACTWSGNSREHRLTPWSNDPVRDPHGEAFYLRDEDDGRFWSLTPGPCPPAVPFEVAHAPGVTSFDAQADGLAWTVRIGMAADDPVRIAHVRVRNHGAVARRVSLVSYVRWVLGAAPTPAREALATETRWDEARRTLWASNASAGEWRDAVAFASVAAPERAEVSATGDRAAFLGEPGDPVAPRALARDARLDGADGPGCDPCGALMVTLALEPGASLDVAFLLGEGRDEAEAATLVRRYARADAGAAELERAAERWRELVGRVRVTSPEPAIDRMVNGWLVYQNLSCRIWGRTAFSQSGGAYGFRDQLQDALALVHHAPAIARAQLLLHAANQFVEGDVLHWWHPPSGRGIRTRFSDDLLWLPLLAATYVETTGDRTVLDERVPFLVGPLLEAGEDERLVEPGASGAPATLYEHGCRAIERSLTRGEHGLPLMGTGDWNDGMNRVGREGRGESVWVGFFLDATLGAFLPFVRGREDSERAERWDDYRAKLRTALEESGWDGDWYRRAYYDDGTPLGTARADECRIDALVQAWSVISGAARPERAARAMDAVEVRLIDERAGIVRLLDPPFDRTPKDPGYIKGYVPGVRENGGQYTHAALWVVQALAALGRRERAARVLVDLSPITHTNSAERVATYRAEPYVVAADVYGVAPHLGRGGWTWYTGSAGWMQRVASESIFGLTLHDGRELRLRPCVPDAWEGFSIDYMLADGATRYRIEVRNPDRCSARAVEASVDGLTARIVAGAAIIPLAADGRSHAVLVRLGA